MTTDVDVLVVGAGPAGATAALAARATAPGLRVLMLDRADFPRDKCCGDGIAPQVVDVLAELGAESVVDGWQPLRRLELSGHRRQVEGRLDRPVWVVPREVFDARLVACACQAGADLVRHRVSEVRREEDRWVVDDRFTCRVLIGADGAHSLVRGVAGRPAPGPMALALRGYAPTDPSRRGVQVIRYGARRQPAYAWSFDRGDGLANVGYGELLGHGTPPTRAQLLEQLDELLPGTVAAGDRWRGHHLPLSGWRWHQPDGSVLLVGDAAGLVNPMTGEGIYYAVATGRAAGRAAAAAVLRDRPEESGADHRRAVRQLLGWHLRHTALVSRLSRRPGVVDAGIHAARRDPRVFDTLLEIGLGNGLVTPRLVGGLVGGLVAGLLPAPASEPA